MWNYRVLRTAVELSEHEYGYEIVEVYYDNNGDIEAVSGPAAAYGESVADLSYAMGLMAKAIVKPVLELIDGEYVEVE